MSGDVQPRKKKDKKRKKEEEPSPSPPLHLFSKETSEDLNIHIHKEEGTGGGICAKIVFFFLFSALIVLIGLIITEHRGLTDLDVAESDSKYSQIFEGWVDDEKLDDHHTLDDHDNEHFDDEEHEDDNHTLDDHDNDHIDDEETNEQSAEEQTLDDHNDEHFDDDEISPPSEENEVEEDVSQERNKYTEKFRTSDRYRREVSEEDVDDDNLTESQEDNSFSIHTNVRVETNDDEELFDSKDEEDTDENIKDDSENIYEEDEENSKIDEDDTDEDSLEIRGADDNSNDSTDGNDIKEDVETEEEDNTKENFKPSDEEYNSEDDDNDSIHRTIKTNDAVDEDKEDISQEEVDRDISKETDDEKDHENSSVENSEQVSEKIDDVLQEFMNDNGEEAHDEKSSEKPNIQEKSVSMDSAEQNIQLNDRKVRDADDRDDDHETDKSGGSDNPGSLSSKKTPSTELDESDSEKFSDDNNDYEFAGVTNKEDWPIRKELDEAQRNLPNNAANALKMFEKVLEKYPSSPRGFYGLAQALDALAEKEKSNEFLEEAILNYFKVSELRNVPDPLYKAALERCIDRTRFRGKYGKAIKIHLKLINRFPDEPKYRNQLTITYLTIGRVEEARLLLNETLQKWPNNGCALVHYGFIWKTTDNDLEKGVYFMQKGIDTKDPCVIDGRFYFHLGDSYSRLGDTNKAIKIYEEAVGHKLFLSKYQRSLYNVPRLTARPWWQNDQLPHYKILLEDLEKNWISIKNEGLSVLNQESYFQDESENLRDTGDWKQFELFARGRRNMKNCNKTPFTCKLLASHVDARGCRRGQIKFSVMHPGTHVWAHCGPTNCRLRIHLGLKVPPNTYIRVGDSIRSWKAGKLLIFDDSFEHEVWHNGTDVRLVLIVDVWHPELTMTEKETLSSL